MLYAFRTTLETRRGAVDLAFTDRYGGVSVAPFDTLNLALEGDDDPAATVRNLALVMADFAPSGADAYDVRQVHGATVDVLEHRRSAARPDADALVTSIPGGVLMVRAADCVPVLLVAPDEGLIGAVHSGRPGLAAGVVPAAVARMRDLGARAMTAWLGPHVCGRCYEVPERLRAEVGGREPAAIATTSWGTPSLDLGAGVRAQLERHDVRVVDAARCTRESPDLYSHRRDGRGAGRLAGLIRMRRG